MSDHARTTSAAPAVVGVLAQVAYPLLSGDALRFATIASVLLLAAAGVLHAASCWGPRGALILLAVAGGLGLLAETVGVHTGFPFGAYAYSPGLGPTLAAVPVVVPLAWTMLAYPCLLLGRRLALSRPRRSSRRRALITAATGGVALASWDLFLDPQMVAQGQWSWTRPAPGLPGVPGVPLTNYAGWLLVAVVMIAALDRALPKTPDVHRNGELVPAGVLAWTWLGSAVGNLVFFDRPWVALYGGLVMGVPVVPYLRLVSNQALHGRRTRGGAPTMTEPLTEARR